MRVLITGGRDFNLPDEVHRILWPIHQQTPIVGGYNGITELGEGGADGADLLCKLWALRFGIPVAEYECSKAEWDVWGNRAGNMRNSRMLRDFKPDLGVSFPGGNGTKDMTTKLLDARIPTFVGRYSNVERTAVKWHLRKGDYVG